MIERFTKEEFEEALAEAAGFFEEEGLVQGEYTYLIPVNEQTRLQVRSSVDSSGIAADTGDDSIRIWIQVYQHNWQDPSEMIWAAGPKLDAYTTRIPGWGKRMNKKVHELWNMAAKLTTPIPAECPHCGRVPFVRFTKKPGKNKGRPWCKCGKFEHQHDGTGGFFQWLDAPQPKGTVIKFEEPKAEELDLDGPTVDLMEEADKAPEPERTKVELEVVDETTTEVETIKEELEEMSEQYEEIIAKAKNGGPNDSQQAFITAPVDENIRLSAPPGSGKTFSIERRVKYMIDQGVAPADILVVTFSKKMSDEMLERIMEVCPNAFKDQISTIHAFCYRVLSVWYDNSPFYRWQVPKDWQIRKLIEEGIEKFWKSLEHEDKPSWKEISYWIGVSKFNGLTVEEARPFFIRTLGARFGNWLADIRQYVDTNCERQKFLTFPDMIYHMERLLQDDKFRTKMQNKFQHVIVDEAQDCSKQALRILIMVGSDPGTNPVYQHGISN